MTALFKPYSSTSITKSVVTLPTIWSLTGILGPKLDNKELFILNIKENIPKRSIGIATSKTHLPSFSAKKLIEIITNK